MAEARAAMGPLQVLLGNVDPVRVLRDVMPATVGEALEECRRAAAPHYVVGARCETPELRLREQAPHVLFGKRGWT